MALTKFREGSIREFLYITAPLMLSFLSVASMTFANRLFLAHYSTECLNAITDAMTVGWTFILGWVILAGISEVFVAQNNGAKNYKKLGNAVWQTIWLSAGSSLFFFPLSCYIGEVFFTGPDQKLEQEFICLLFQFGPLFPLYYALTSFFMGQGKIRLVTILVITTNILNIGFDYYLIFGIPNWLDPLGLKGSALATGLSSLFQDAVLMGIFLSPSNRQKYGTDQWQFNGQLIKKYFKIGLPGAFFAVIEMSAWATYYLMITKLGERHLTIASVTQSLFILFYFFTEAITKGISTITGNLIGAQNSSMVSQVLKIGVCLHFTFSSLFFLLSYLFIDKIIAYFLPYASVEEITNIRPSLLYCLLVYSCYLFFDGTRQSFVRVLTSAGDTFFILIGGSLSVWVLLVWPVYQFVYLNKGTIEQAVTIVLIYSILAGAIYLHRFYKGYWQSLVLIEKPPN